jgi:hypothetical protein
MHRIAALALAGLGAVALAACEPRGPAERAGEQADSAYEEATQGSKDFRDGPMENAGEAIDRAAGQVKESVEDAGAAIERETREATDGKKSP